MRESAKEGGEGPGELPAGGGQVEGKGGAEGQAESRITELGGQVGWEHTTHCTLLTRVGLKVHCCFRGPHC